MWRAVLQRTGSRPSLSWLRYLSLHRFEGEDRAVLRVAPGHREMIAFATEARLAPVAEQLSELIGRRVRLVVDAGPRTATDAQADDHAAHHDAATGDAPEAPHRTGAGDRRQAMSLPIVKRAFETFGDLTLIDARPEPPDVPDTPPSDTPDAPDADGTSGMDADVDVDLESDTDAD